MASRRTRAGTRPTIHEDRTSREGSPVIQTSTPTRTPAVREPLVELVNTANTPQPEANIILEIDLSKPARKAGRTDVYEAPQGILVPYGAPNKENLPEVEEDRYQTTASPAVDAACRNLRKSPGKASSQRPVLDSSRTPVSRAATSARKLLNGAESNQHSSKVGEKGAAELLENDLGSRASKATPAPLADNERLEDSVVAFDALEDVIEEIGAALPTTMTSSAHNTLLDGVAPIVDDTEQSLATINHSNEAGVSAPDNKSKASTDPSAARKVTTLKRKPDASKPAGQSSKTPKQTPQSKPSHTSQPSGRRSMTAPRSAQRPASLRKAPFVPERSSKPATVSTFALPGETVAAKLKARREEREKRASLTAQPEKPTVARRHSATLRPTVNTATVRGTTFAGPNNRARPQAAAASRAPTLASVTRTKPPTRGSIRVAKPSVAVAPSRTTGKRTSSAGTTTTQVNGSTRASHKAPVTVTRPPRSLAGIFTPPTSEEEGSASGSVSGGVSGISSPSSRSTRPRAAVIARAAAAPTASAARPTVPKAATINPAALRQERKAREEAARKARAEVAERNRLASRAWAERHQQRTAAAAKVAKKTEEKVEREEKVAAVVVSCEVVEST